MGRASVVRGPGGFSGGALALDAPETNGGIAFVESWGYRAFHETPLHGLVVMLSG